MRADSGSVFDPNLLEVFFDAVVRTEVVDRKARPPVADAPAPVAAAQTPAREESSGAGAGVGGVNSEDASTAASPEASLAVHAEPGEQTPAGEMAASSATPENSPAPAPRVADHASGLGAEADDNDITAPSAPAADAATQSRALSAVTDSAATAEDSRAASEAQLGAAAASTDIASQGHPNGETTHDDDAASLSPETASASATDPGIDIDVPVDAASPDARTV